jgi:hypothetical protein
MNEFSRKFEGQSQNLAGKLLVDGFSSHVAYAIILVASRAREGDRRHRGHLQEALCCIFSSPLWKRNVSSTT